MMKNVANRKVLGGMGCYQLLLTGLVALSLLLSSGTILFLLSIGSQARTFVQQAATDLETLSETEISYTVSVSQLLPIHTEIYLEEEILVPVDMVISHTVPLDAEVPFLEGLVFPIETSIKIEEEFVVPINQTIAINDSVGVTLPTFGGGSTVVEVPIQASFPISMAVPVLIDRQLPIKTEIPLRLPAARQNATFPDGLPLQIPIKTELVVPIKQIVPIDVEVPLQLEVPLTIPLNETPFGDYLRNLSRSLRQAVGG